MSTNILGWCVAALIGWHQCEFHRVGQYVIQHGGSATAGYMLCCAVIEAETAGCSAPDPMLLACIARYESGFDIEADNGTCRGLLQVHQIHRGSMADMGLDYDVELDRLVYACWLYSWHGMQPWAVRRKAKAAYRRYIKSGT
jgi:hypothetical protein